MKKTVFTLIELLVVIAIIAILAAMLLPALNSARGKARAIKCMGDQKSMGMAFMVYAGDFGEMVFMYNSKGNPGNHWPKRLINENYITNYEQVTCPETYKLGYGKTSYNMYGIPGARSFAADYSCETTVQGGYVDTYFFVKKVRNHSAFPWLADCGKDMNDISGPVFQSHSTVAKDSTFLMRHADNVNIFFLDGHAAGAGVQVLKDARKGMDDDSNVLSYINRHNIRYSLDYTN